MEKLAGSLLFVVLTSFAAIAQVEYSTPVSLHLATARKVFEAGTTRDVYVQVQSQGSENAFTFTFEWDTTRFANPRASLADGLAGYALTVNPYYTHMGRLGILVDGWNPLPAGRVNLVRITFDVFPNEGRARFKFSPNLMMCSTSDVQGYLAPTEYYDVWANVGTYNRTPPSQRQTEIPLFPDGSGLSMWPNIDEPLR